MPRSPLLSLGPELAESLLSVADDLLGFLQGSFGESQLTPTRLAGSDTEKPDARFDTGFHQFNQDLVGEASLVRLKHMTTLLPLRVQE